MPYHQNDKDLTTSSMETYTDLAKGKEPPYKDPELPHTLKDAIELEREVLQDTIGAATDLIHKKGDQNEIADYLSQASSAIDALDQIALMTRKHGLNKA